MPEVCIPRPSTCVEPPLVKPQIPRPVVCPGRPNHPVLEIVLHNIAKSTAEGPIWLHKEKSLLFNDGYDGDFNIWNSETKEIKTIHYDTFATFTVPHQKGGFVAGVGQKVIHLQWDDPHNYKLLAEVDKGKPTRLVDGKCDSRGRLFFATMGLESKPAVPVLESASLYSIDTDGTLTCHDSGMHIANSMVWSPDEKTLYLTETIPGFIYAYDYDIKTGKTSNRRIVIYLPPTEHGLVDRMTIDTDGMLWTCYYRGGKTTQIDPNEGKIIRTIKLPCATVTCPTFGGDNFDQLFITSSSYHVDRSTNPHGGSIWRISNTGAKGYAPNPYKGK